MAILGVLPWQHASPRLMIFLSHGFTTERYSRISRIQGRDGIARYRTRITPGGCELLLTWKKKVMKVWTCSKISHGVFDSNTYCRHSTRTNKDEEGRILRDHENACIEPWAQRRWVCVASNGIMNWKNMKEATLDINQTGCYEANYFIHSKQWLELSACLILLAYSSRGPSALGRWSQQTGHVRYVTTLYLIVRWHQLRFRRRWAQ